jgi:oxygen-dependent protoporphyrinogen oxidase
VSWRSNRLVRTSAGRELVVDATLVAAPADAAAHMLRASLPAVAAELAEIRYTSVTVIWLAFPTRAFGRAPDTTGFLVPRGERRLLTACTLASAKWPHLAAHRDRVFLRCSVGRNDPEAATLDDEALIRRVFAELGEALNAQGEPLDAHVTRWQDAMPQYTVGHLERIARLDQALAALPRLRLAGAAYRGVGVTQCIAQGEAAAAQIVSALA